MPKMDGTPTKRELDAIKRDLNRRESNRRVIASWPDAGLYQFAVFGFHDGDLTETVEREMEARSLL